jgi:hypothetical protein
MTFDEMLDDDLNEVFFDVEEFGVEITLKLDNKEETFIGIFDIKTEVLFNDEIVDTQPSILVTQEIAEKIKHRSILVIHDVEYQRSHDDEENVDLIRIFLERA